MENQEYQVVARRYRPQTFADLVGQEPIARALSNAITGNRIGHAYLFTGARGVGKTSSARIFAKSLNCVHGPTPTPCNECEICKSISTGDDIDVLEIDGASNRGIEDIRSLRQNVNVRPIRARFKIYIIDEVHMLTREAFNALLKTLEEPPEHVKFIFCTTEVGKIPITILSRCQRFDFAGIDTTEIAKRLGEIVTAEGLSAEPAALTLIARRANGSMRDGQSLLEQILAFVSERVTLEDVHRLLGTADDEVLQSLLKNICELDPASMLRTMDAVVLQGGDPSSLLEQLFGYLRDLMALAAGCGSDSLLFADSTQEETLRGYAQKLGMETILAAMQIIDHTLARMKVSTQARLLAEMALVRLSSLGSLENLADFLAKIQPIRSVETGTASVALPAPETAASGFAGNAPTIGNGAFSGGNGTFSGGNGAFSAGNPAVASSAFSPESTAPVQAPLQPPAGMTRSFSSEVPSDFEQRMAAKKKEGTNATSGWERPPVTGTVPAPHAGSFQAQGTSAFAADTGGNPSSSATASASSASAPAGSVVPAASPSSAVAPKTAVTVPAVSQKTKVEIPTVSQTVQSTVPATSSVLRQESAPNPVTSSDEAISSVSTFSQSVDVLKSADALKSGTSEETAGSTGFVASGPISAQSVVSQATNPPTAATAAASNAYGGQLSAVKPQVSPEAALRNALNALEEGGYENEDELDVLFRFSHVQVSNDGSSWTVEYDPSHKFAISRCGGSGITSKIERELAESLHHPVRIQLQTLDEAKDSAGNPVVFVSLAEEREIARKHPLIQAAELHLNATIQRVERVRKQEGN